ncbi:MAG: hypothetical protein K2K57_06455, partial [Oscillospiraceae bacterium]|nr:hypothetical protein [Oscillospiraceae bacterium]
MEVFIMVVQHNIPAMNANRYFGINNSGLSKSLEKLSSGYAINRAGDNAAGLAVSEKMRSQIAGLTQGVKNAQDGISMIQTYEGALTETDSILQRMKTLADQAANGTYQDDVDRDAIQLEFNQLNDELDQIADTDFNGVVVLNGGQMADGTKAINGKFDYANGTREAKQLNKADIKMLDSQQFNDTKVTASVGSTKADAAWNALFSSDRTNAAASDDGPDSFEATFQYDASTGTWSAIKATNGADKADLTVATTDNGGFSVTAGGVEMSNVTIDKSTLMNGDTITLRYNNPATVTKAPSNATAEIANSTLKGAPTPTAAGATVTAADGTGTKGSAGSMKALGENDANLIVDVNKSVAMTQDIEDLFNLLENATVTGHYTDGTATAAGDMTITFDDPGVAAVTNSADAKRTIGTTEFTFTSAADGVTIKAGTTVIAKLSMTQQTGTTAGEGASGDVTWNIKLAEHAYDNSKVPSVEVVEDESKVSISNSNNYATAPLTYTDHVVLQAGARTKDSVDFTFKYSSGGLGDLKSNMNCSSRADGLGTANLKLTDQKSANYAIDRIDNAINKVSMVRATFGAVQNRLEHKIDNMNVTKENITSA